MVLCLKAWKSRTLPGYKNYENSKFTKISKKRDLNSKLVRRRGRVYIINKKILNSKQDKNSFMDNESHKNTWNNFTKFVLWGTIAVICVLVLMAIFLL